MSGFGITGGLELISVLECLYVCRCARDLALIWVMKAGGLGGMGSHRGGGKMIVVLDDV